jgi:intraflagellar transport protein 74
MDSVVIFRKDMAIKEAEKKMAEEKALAEQLILKLADTSKQAQYIELKRENELFLQEIREKTAKLDQLSAEYKRSEAQVGSNSQKQKAVSLYQKLTAVKEKRAELELVIQKTELESGPQERNRLLEQVKTDNLETSGMERKIAEVEASTKTVKEQLALIGGEMDQANEEKQLKYEELMKKDQEMQEFLDSFEVKREEIRNVSRETEGAIVLALARIQALGKKDMSNLPTKQDFKELSTDLVVKQTDLRNADSTTEALTRGSSPFFSYNYYRTRSAIRRFGKSRTTRIETQCGTRDPGGEDGGHEDGSISSWKYPKCQGKSSI